MIFNLAIHSYSHCGEKTVVWLSLFFSTLDLNVDLSSPTNESWIKNMKQIGEEKMEQTTICFLFQGTVCEGFGYVSLVVIFSFIYNITKFMEFETVYEREDPGDSNR